MKAIVNANKKWAIGWNGKLLVNIPEDMRYFREQTKGAIVIMGRKTLFSFPGKRPLKGRLNLVLTRDSSSIPPETVKASDKYYDLSSCALLRDTLDESLPSLPEAFNGEFFTTAKNYFKLIRDSNGNTKPETVLVVINALDDLLKVVKRIEDESTDARIFVIGGASIYSLLIKYCDTCLVTMNDCPLEGDSFFPDLSMDPVWRLAKKGELKEYNGIHFSFDMWENVFN